MNRFDTFTVRFRTVGKIKAIRLLHSGITGRN